MNTTPLRYPGGKSVMSSFFAELIAYNNLRNVTYAEPYAGGAGAAINLLLAEKVKSIRINDASICLYSFWHYLLAEPNKFIDRIDGSKVDLSEWNKQRQIYKTTKKPSFDLGFATFFLSRTNRSGILNAGPMGGQDPTAQDQATYKIDCRFNKVDLIKRVQDIVEKKKLIAVTNKDAIKFISKIKDRNTLVYLDPPYYKQGKALYMNFYAHGDHVDLATYLKGADHFNWVLSYDNVKQIRNLYSEFPLYEFSLLYTAQSIKKGSELLTHSETVKMPESLSINNKIKLELIQIPSISS